jgi:uncharacterized protein
MRMMEEIIVLKGQELDLSEVVWNNLILQMNMVYLCRPDCKGLCSKCCQNLNVGDCG